MGFLGAKPLQRVAVSQAAGTRPALPSGRPFLRFYLVPSRGKPFFAPVDDLQACQTPTSRGAGWQPELPRACVEACSRLPTQTLTFDIFVVVSALYWASASVLCSWRVASALQH